MENIPFLIKSESIDKLSSDFIKAQNEVKSVDKNKENPFFRSTYADLTNVIESTRPVLCKHNLGVTHIPCGDKIIVLLLHITGQYLGGAMDLRCDKPGPQSQGSAYSYSRRYSYKGIIGIADSDDDAEKAEGRNGKNTNSTQNKNQSADKTRTTSNGKITEKQRKFLFKCASDMGWDPTVITDTMNMMFQKSSSSELTVKEASELIDIVKNHTPEDGTKKVLEDMQMNP